MSKTVGSALLLGGSGLAIAGIPGLVGGLIVGGICGAAADSADSRVAKDDKALCGIHSDSSTGRVVQALNESGRKQVSFKNETKVTAHGKRYRDTRSRTVKRD